MLRIPGARPIKIKNKKQVLGQNIKMPPHKEWNERFVLEKIPEYSAEKDKHCAVFKKNERQWKQQPKIILGPGKIRPGKRPTTVHVSKNKLIQSQKPFSRKLDFGRNNLKAAGETRDAEFGDYTGLTPKKENKNPNPSAIEGFKMLQSSSKEEFSLVRENQTTSTTPPLFSNKPSTIMLHDHPNQNTLTGVGNLGSSSKKIYYVSKNIPMQRKQKKRYSSVNAHTIKNASIHKKKTPVKAASKHSGAPYSFASNATPEKSSINYQLSHPMIEELMKLWEENQICPYHRSMFKRCIDQLPKNHSIPILAKELQELVNKKSNIQRLQRAIQAREECIDGIHGILENAGDNKEILKNPSFQEEVRFK